MEINQISQLVQLIGKAGNQGTTVVSGNESSGDTSSSFEALLKQMVSDSQNQTLNNTGTSVPGTDSKDNIVNGLDNLSLQSQKAQQLQQMVLQQMMQSMTAQDSSSSSSIGTTGSDDKSDSLFPSRNINKDLTQLIQTIVQGQTNASSVTNSLTK
ncbi:MAG: hypothetical protein H7Y18_08460 [Clostridiaceae bacterium]|nr:hypothetical protein [Clostridiaceae bacterium]